VRQLLLRLTGTAAAVAALIVVAVAVLFHAVTGAAELQARAQADLAAVVGVAELTADGESLRRAIARTSSGREGRVAVRAGDRTVGRSRLPAGAPATGETAVDGGTLLVRVVGDGRVVEVLSPTWRPGGADVLLLGVLATAAAAGTACGIAITRRGIRPVACEVEAATSQARDLAATHAPPPPAAASTPETAALAAALAAVAGHIDDVRTAERRLLADLSHRLRTPLTALALDVGSIGDGPVAVRVRRAVSAMERDVDSLIRAVRPVAGPVRCDVVDVVNRRMAFWAPLGRHRGRVCHVDICPPPAAIGLAADDLAAVLDALLGNVFQHTPDGGPFAVHVVRHAGWITMVVDDAGPGVADPAAALRRGVSGSGSTGLGLDIARDAVEASGGTIHVERAALGGARIRLRFSEVGTEHADPHEPRAWRLWRGDGHPSPGDPPGHDGDRR
jgi:signal transduction histidine kinase